jgi:hypothetical protein
MLGFLFLDNEFRVTGYENRAAKEIKFRALNYIYDECGIKAKEWL